MNCLINSSFLKCFAILFLVLGHHSFIFTQKSLTKEIERLIKSDEIEKALITCNAQMFKTENSAVLYYYRGMCYRKFGDYEKALKDLEIAKKLDSLNYEIYAELGTVCTLSEDSTSALKYYNKSIKLNNRSSTTYNSLGGFYYGLINNDSLAYIYFKKAIELDKNNFRAQFNMGNLLNYVNRHDEAIPYLKKSSKLKTKNSKTFLELGKSYYNLGNYKKGIDCLKKAEKYNLNLDPNERVNFSEIYSYTSRCYKRIGNREKENEYEALFKKAEIVEAEQ